MLPKYTNMYTNIGECLTLSSLGVPAAALQWSEPGRARASTVGVSCHACAYARCEHV